MTTNNDQLNQLTNQSIFTSALIVASSINLMIIHMYKDILINKDNSKYNRKQIYSLAILVSNIFLIVTIYFLIEAYEAYENSNSTPNYNYYMAAVLSFTAQSIRINTLYKYPETILQTQDIL